jgi:hypothetical protein
MMKESTIKALSKGGPFENIEPQLIFFDDLQTGAGVARRGLCSLHPRRMSRPTMIFKGVPRRVQTTISKILEVPLRKTVSAAHLLRLSIVVR